MVGTQSFSYRWGFHRATMEPLPFRSLQRSGCLCLIPGRALGTCRRGSYLHTRLPAGERASSREREGGGRGRRGSRQLLAGRGGQVARNAGEQQPQSTQLSCETHGRTGAWTDGAEYSFSTQPRMNSSQHISIQLSLLRGRVC